MASRTGWTDEAKAQIYVQWVANDRNVRKTSREFGIPHGTLRYWTKEWEESGPPAELNDIIANDAYEFVHHANRVREQAMLKLEELIPQAESKQLSAIATVVGIMDDKIRLASGLATKRMCFLVRVMLRNLWVRLLKGLLVRLLIGLMRLLMLKLWSNPSWDSLNPRSR